MWCIWWFRCGDQIKPIGDGLWGSFRYLCCRAFFFSFWSARISSERGYAMCEKAKVSIFLYPWSTQCKYLCSRILYAKLVFVYSSAGMSLAEQDLDRHSRALSEDVDLPIFDLETVVKATDNFSLANKIGEGGFGPVYKVHINMLCVDTYMQSTRGKMYSVTGMNQCRRGCFRVEKKSLWRGYPRSPGKA